MGRISMPQGKGSQMHNRRDYEKYGKKIPENIDTSRSSQNITFVDRDIREAYKEIFGKALKEYNDKQKRADRRIDDYFEHIMKSKNKEKLFYEDVVQWGSREDFVNSPETVQKARDALVEYVLTFEQRNPNLKLIGAYIHMDEASPHLHIDYVPVATGYKQGLPMRNSLDRAMREMGFQPDKSSKKNNATKLWKENERKVFGEICRSFGLEVEEERKARGSLSVDEYKEARDKMVGEIEAEIKPLRELEIDIAAVPIIRKPIMLNKKEVKVDLSELDHLEQQAQAGIAIRSQIEEFERDKEWIKWKKNLYDLQEKRISDQNIEIGQLREYVGRATRAERELETERRRNAPLKDEVDILRGEMEKMKVEHTDKVKWLSDRLAEAYGIIGDIVRAIKTLKYDQEWGYGIRELPDQSSRLIDAIASFAVKATRKMGFVDLAEKMNGWYGVDRDISELVKHNENSVKKEKKKDAWER